MNSVAIFVKRNGILVACKPHPAPDGVTWQCGTCGMHPLLRVSFGVMSGLYRCTCGAEVEMFVDGIPLKVEEVAKILPAPAQITPAPEAANAANVPVKPRRKRTRKLTDADFLRECGIATEGEPNARRKNSD